jgi:phosphoglucomutase
MSISPRAGTLPDQSLLVDVPLLVSEYYTRSPDPNQRGESRWVGTAGPPGSARKGAVKLRHNHARTPALVA